ncbi:Flp pilus assembly complex ATPase component TadA [Candidatus Woesebacteria bacterium]|nr:Flp pilus assembly complex ATPase component TadA [Candidatus Woesebacteria bacterium]
MPVPAQPQDGGGVRIPPSTPIQIGGTVAPTPLSPQFDVNTTDMAQVADSLAALVENDTSLLSPETAVQPPQTTPTAIPSAITPTEIPVTNTLPSSPISAPVGLSQSDGTPPSEGVSQTAVLPEIEELSAPVAEASVDSPSMDPSAPVAVMDGVTPVPMAAPTSDSSVPPTPAVPPVVPANMGDKKYANLIDVMVGQGWLNQNIANKLLVDQITTGKTVETLVNENNLVSEEKLTRAKAIYNNVPFIKLSEVGIFPEALNQLPEGAARHYAMLPFTFDKTEGTLSVAMKDPLDLSAIDFAQQKTGFKIVAYFAVPSEVDRMIAEYYSQTLSSEVTAALEQTTQMAEAQAKKSSLGDLSKETIRQAPITKIVETLVAFAIKARASDIHIEPLEDRTRVRYRIDGILNEKLILPKSVHEAVVSRIKILSGLKIDEKRLPQDGRFNFATQEQEVDLRVSTLPTINGEKIVMRLLKKDATVPALPELGLDGFALHKVEESIKVPHGIILITGPTGSGKTTTLYSILHTVNTPKVNIMTLEDPVEYQMIGVNQVQINPQAGLTFASGLRSFLRQDPNVIMVGEIRDSETAELAIQAALTGHLVFSTLHTSSAAGALPRLMDMGAEPFLLASSMTCVMAQRVLRTLHKDYKEEYSPEKAIIDDIKEVLGEKFDSWCKKNNKDPDHITLWRSRKDRPESEPEYKGRIAIFEVMKITEEIAKLILERKPATDMEKVAMRDGMLLMKQDGYFKALAGLTTIEEVLRVAQI